MRVSLFRITDGLQHLQSRHRVLRFGLGVGLLGAGTLILIGLSISSIPSPAGSFAALLLALGTLVIGTAPSGDHATLPTISPRTRESHNGDIRLNCI